MEITQINPAELKNYPLNIQLYGNHVDADFVESVVTNGIATPIVVCKSSNPLLDGFIVKGRRRRVAALTARLKTVPVVYWKCDDQLTFEHQLILDNVRNETTMEERVRMYEQLKRIEAERLALKLRADENKGENGTSDPKPSRRKSSAEKAAGAVQMSPNTAKKGAEVVHAADELRNNGKTQEADEVLHALNNGSVAAGERKVKEVTGPAPAAPPKADNEYSKAIDGHVAKLQALVKKVEEEAAKLFNALDRKAEAEPAMKSQKPKYEKMMRHFGELQDSVTNHAGVIAKAWENTRKAVDQ